MLFYIRRLLIEHYTEIEVSAAGRPVIARPVNRRRGVHYRRRSVHYGRRRIVDIAARPVGIGAVVALIVMVFFIITVVVMLMVSTSFPGHAVVRHSEYEGY